MTPRFEHISHSLDPGTAPPPDEQGLRHLEQTPPKRKALFIGIHSTYIPSKKKHAKAETPPIQGNQLKGPHQDVKGLRQLLIDVYNFSPEDTVTLLDEKEYTQPTEANILKAISQLVQDAKTGDCFFFHYTGHSGQKESNDPKEEDKMDEYILASDGKEILDNTLYDQLVEPLPVGSSLTAVIDSCHSCTLLDLKHYRCNRVYVPWVNRGKRRTKTRHYFLSRKQAMFTAIFQSPKNTLFSDVSLPFIRSFFASTPKPTSDKSLTSTRQRPTPIKPKLTRILSTASRIICNSPVPEFCEGFDCHRYDPIETSPPKADICISSSRDDQKTWEDVNGRSMTQILIEELRKDPHPVLYDLMSNISFAIYYAMCELHTEGRKYKKAFNRAETAAKAEARASQSPDNQNAKEESAKANEKKRNKLRKPRRAVSVEISNFQNPELSSHYPVDMKNRKWSI